MRRTGARCASSSPTKAMRCGGSSTAATNTCWPPPRLRWTTKSVTACTTTWSACCTRCATKTDSTPHLLRDRKLMRLHLIAAAVGLTLALAGCASSGGLHPDGTPIAPSALKSSHSLATVPVGAAWPAADWWTGLGDPRLDALIREALADNPSLAIADARTRQAQA